MLGLIVAIVSALAAVIAAAIAAFGATILGGLAAFIAIFSLISGTIVRILSLPFRACIGSDPPSPLGIFSPLFANCRFA
jgi:hypothetical protein